MNTSIKVKRCIFAFVRKVGRLFYGKNVWLLCDRETAAGDNGEALFSYLQNKPVTAYFAVSADSSDYARLCKTGKVVAYNSIFHKFLLCVADAHLSSHIEHMENHVETPQIFLQHGVTYNNISIYLDKSCHKNFYIITSAKAEQESFFEEQYRIRKENVWLTGLPRHDLLQNATKKIITISFTWRKYLSCGPSDRVQKSDLYFNAYRALLNDDKFLEALESHGYCIYVKLHPLMNKFQDMLQYSDKVKVWDTSYADIFSQSALLITDYSSIAFDFALLQKPVIYYQFDEDLFWASEKNYEKGYFDCRRDGFGEVVTEDHELKALILNYVQKECVMKQDYQKRMKEFFAYHDANNCERVYNKVQELLENKSV